MWITVDNFVQYDVFRLRIYTINSSYYYLKVYESATTCQERILCAPEHMHDCIVQCTNGYFVIIIVGTVCLYLYCYTIS